MKNSNTYYRYYSPRGENWVSIAYSDEITNVYYFREVLYHGISQIIEELGIDYSVEEALNGTYFWVFNDNSDSFKISWQFEDSGKTPYSLKADYYAEGDTILDREVLYDYTTYEEALDFIQAYISGILTNGVPQAPEVEYNESDVATLKLMHGIMQSMNDENAYFSWVSTGVPDGATEEDYIDIASDPDEFAECQQLFDSLFTRYAPEGLFRPTSEEVAFANQVCKRLGLPTIEVLE